MITGRGKEYPEFFLAEEACAREEVEHCEENLGRGADADLVPSAS
jgi:hypothetical protein